LNVLGKEFENFCDIASVPVPLGRLLGWQGSLLLQRMIFWNLRARNVLFVSHRAFRQTKRHTYNAKVVSASFSYMKKNVKTRALSS
jgi:hypothetical protein